MMNGEERGCFNILDSIRKQAAHKFLDGGKTAASVAECRATSTGWRVIEDCTDQQEHTQHLSSSSVLSPN